MPDSSSPAPIRLATRGSKLARWQADWVAGQLRQRGHEVAIVEVTTRGDAESASPIGDIGTGAFTKEIQRAVLTGDADVAVHSLKDLPTEVVSGLVLAAVPVRESVADVVVGGVGSRESGVGKNLKDDALAKLPLGARVGTGSLRRQAQLRHARPDLQVEGVRGNVDTRLAKLDAGEFDALILAEAGLTRLGLAERISQILSPDTMLPAVGQGALGIECRDRDAATRSALAALDDVATHAAVIAERALLAHLLGGCLAPVGAWGRVERDQLHLTAVVLSADGRERIEESSVAPLSDAIELGRRVADALLARGAAELIAASRS
jgi:hydroxymethylbilane synthase